MANSRVEHDIETWCLGLILMSLMICTGCGANHLKNIKALEIILSKKRHL